MVWHSVLPTHPYVTLLIQKKSHQKKSLVNSHCSTLPYLTVNTLTEIICEVRQAESFGGYWVSKPLNKQNKLSQCSVKSILCLVSFFLQKLGYRNWHSKFPRRPCSESSFERFWGVHMAILLVSPDTYKSYSKT